MSGGVSQVGTATRSTSNQTGITPSGVAAGDVLVAHIAGYNWSYDHRYVPAGWCLIQPILHVSGGDDNIGSATFYYVCGASTPGTHVWTDPFGSGTMIMTAWRGVDTASAVSAFSPADGFDAAPTASTLTAGAGDMLLWLWMGDCTFLSSGPTGYSVDVDGTTERSLSPVASCGNYGAYHLVSAGGTTGAVPSVAAGTDDWVVQFVAMRAADPWPAISLVGGNAAQNNPGGGTGFTIPSALINSGVIQAGDLGVLIVQTASNGNDVAVAGWTSVGGNAGDNTRTFWRLMTGSESSGWAMTCDDAFANSYNFSVWRGVDPVTPFLPSPSSTNDVSGSWDAGSVTVPATTVAILALSNFSITGTTALQPTVSPGTVLVSPGAPNDSRNFASFIYSSVVPPGPLDYSGVWSETGDIQSAVFVLNPASAPSPPASPAGFYAGDLFEPSLGSDF